MLLVARYAAAAMLMPAAMPPYLRQRHAAAMMPRARSLSYAGLLLIMIRALLRF